MTASTSKAGPACSSLRHFTTGTPGRSNTDVAPVIHCSWPSDSIFHHQPTWEADTRQGSTVRSPSTAKSWLAPDLGIPATRVGPGSIGSRRPTLSAFPADYVALTMRPPPNAGEGGDKALTRSALNAPGEVPASLRKTS